MEVQDQGWSNLGLFLIYLKVEGSIFLFIQVLDLSSSYGIILRKSLELQKANYVSKRRNLFIRGC